MKLWVVVDQTKSEVMGVYDSLEAAHAASKVYLEDMYSKPPLRGDTWGKPVEFQVHERYFCSYGYTERWHDEHTGEYEGDDWVELYRVDIEELELNAAMGKVGLQ